MIDRLINYENLFYKTLRTENFLKVLSKKK